MSALPPSPAGDWPQVLGQVEEALVTALTQLQQREQALAAVAVPPAPVLDFQRFQDCRAALDACPLRAAERLAEWGDALRDGEEALRRWLAQTAALRQRA